MMDLPDALIEESIERGTILHSTMFKNIDHGKSTDTFLTVHSLGEAEFSITPV
jgi:hypothetical protein